MATVDKTLLKLAQIPTKNQIRIIDNYSPTFNYIVEDIRASKAISHRKKLKESDEYSKDILHRN